jgi:glycerol-3-phosphate acyltransferase PlsY
MIQLVICGQSGFFGNMTQSGLNEMYVLYFLLLCMAFLRHRHNIVRLIKGTERKTYLSKKKKIMEAE